MSRSAVFFPTPGARARAVASPAAIAAAISAGRAVVRSDIAAFGPTPETVMSISKSDSSSRVSKP